MDLHKLGCKLFLQSPADPDLRQCIPVFHQWIQQRAVADHLLIDVHDYAHVPQGPGILLVGHQGNFSTDEGADGQGLAYYRKQPLSGDLKARLAAVVRITLDAALALESNAELAGWRFRGDRMLLFANDRLAAPNTAETLARFQPHAEQLAAQLFGGATVTITPATDDPRERLAVQLATDRDPGLAALRQQV